MPIKILDYCIEGDDKTPALSYSLTRYAPGMFDMAIAQAYQFKSQFDVPGGIKEHNPALIMAMYCNGTHVGVGSPEANNMPSSWFVKDAQGNKVRSNNAPNYLMNPRSTSTYDGAAGWSAWVARKIETNLLDCRFSGAYIDELGIGPITNYDLAYSGPPVDSASGSAKTLWTWTDWITNCLDILTKVKNRPGLSGKPVFVNGLGNGARYFETDDSPAGIAPVGGATKRFVSPSTGALAESFLRGADQPSTYYPTTPSYDRDMAMIADAGAKCMAMTKCWQGTTTERNRILRWALGTFLLNAASGAYWYSTAIRATSLTTWRGEWAQAKRLGNPTGARNGLTRTFAGGSVTVNNTTHDATITVA